MKHLIRYFYVLSVLLLTSLGAWADSTVNVITQVDGVATTSGGQVTADVVEGICKLTAQPAAGYFITADDIKVMKLVTGGQAQAPRKSPALAEPLELTPVDVTDPSGTTTYSFVIPDETYYVEVTADFHPYGLMIDHVPVTSVNRLDVLGDGGSVQYDGNSILFLKNATLSVGIKSPNQQLTILLEGDNNINTNGTAIMSLVNDAILAFNKIGNTPGRLTIKNAQDETGKLIVNFGNPVFENNLTVLEGDVNGSYVAIGTPVDPFVDNSKEEKNYKLEDLESKDLSNTNINDVLFTLQQGDYTPQNDYIILQSTMIEDDVDGIIENYTPGTEDYAKNFSGLTFMLPAGSGKVILNVRTGANGVLCVKIGNDDPYVINNLIDFTDIVIPYACTEDTYVHIYNASQVTEAQSARMKAGKKTTITVGIRSVGVQADQVQSSCIAANVSAGVVPLSSSDVMFTPGSSSPSGSTTTSPRIKVAQAAANSLPDGLFSAYGYASFIDLRETSLADITVNRSEGPFMGVSPNTFIFMPAGNHCNSNEPNVVIGSVCNLVVLDGNMPEGESFEIADGFMAQKVVLDRQFAKDELTTLYLPFDIDQQLAATLGSFYTYNRMENGYVKVDAQEDGLAAHTPALFKPLSDDVQIVARAANISLPGEPIPARRMVFDADANAEADGLYGSYFHCQGIDGAFRLLPSTSFTELSFVRMNADEETLPFQCYLLANGLETDELKVTDDEGVVTTLRGVQTVMVDEGEWFTVSGLRISKPTAKGLYIFKGQKHVVR